MQWTRSLEQETIETSLETDKLKDLLAFPQLKDHEDLFEHRPISERSITATHFMAKMGRVVDARQALALSCQHVEAGIGWKWHHPFHLSHN